MTKGAMMKRLLLGALFSLFMAAAVAGTPIVQTVTPAAYTSLGSGPMVVQAYSGGPILVVTGSAQPAAGAVGVLLKAGDVQTFETTDTVWASTPVPSAIAVAMPFTASGGGGGASSSFAAAFPSTGTAIGAKNGANMVNLTADGSGNLDINCAVGCVGGTSSNASSGVTTSSTNGASVAWLYMFNGTTWDQAQDDASKNLKINLRSSAGTELATSGAPLRTDPTGTTTQPVSAASLPLPAGAATSALQSTINTTLGSPFQAGGSIGNTSFGISGTLPAFAATPAFTASAGGGMDAAGINSSFPGNEFVIGGVYNSAPPSLTSGNASPLLLDANGNLAVSSASLLAAISSPLTPCTTSNCSGENPVGPVLISGTLPAFAATPTVNLGTIGGAATAANQPTAATAGSTTSGQSGTLLEVATLTAAPTYTNAQTNPAYLDAAGNLQVGNGEFTVAAVTFTVTNVVHYPGTVLCCSGGLHGIQLLKTGLAGRLKKLSISSKAIVSGVGIKVYIFSSTPSTTFTDATAPSIASADANLILDVIPLSPPDSGLGTHTVWTSPPLDIPLNNINTYAVPIITGSASFTPATGDFQMRASGTY
jgi:hypothetical protein